MENFLDINAPNNEMIINDSFKIDDGNLRFRIVKTETKVNVHNGLGLEKTLPMIIIEGEFSTKHYVNDLRKIESTRYILSGIDVIGEEYSSENDDIIYKFKCEQSQVKYQYEAIELNKENDGLEIDE